MTLSAVWGSGPTDVYAVGTKGYACLILHTTGDGHWTEQSTGVNGGLYTVWGSGPHDVYVGGFGDTLLHSTGDGVWTRQTIPAVGPLQIWGTGAGDLYFTYANSSGVVYHSTGNGTWSAMTIGDSSSILMTMWGPSASDVHFAGGDGTNAINAYIVHGPSNPTAETMPAADGTRHDLRRLWGSSGSDVYGVGDAYAIFHSAGTGTWIAQAGPPGGGVFLDVWGSGSTDVYAVSDQAGLYHTTGDGTWTVDPDVHNQSAGIWGSGPNDIYVVGTSIMHRTR